MATLKLMTGWSPDNVDFRPASEVHDNKAPKVVEHADHGEAMKVARKVMSKYRDTLRALAK